MHSAELFILIVLDVCFLKVKVGKGAWINKQTRHVSNHSRGTFTAAGMRRVSYWCHYTSCLSDKTSNVTLKTLYWTLKKKIQKKECSAWICKTVSLWRGHATALTGVSIMSRQILRATISPWQGWMWGPTSEAIPRLYSLLERDLSQSPGKTSGARELLQSVWNGCRHSLPLMYDQEKL